MSYPEIKELIIIIGSQIVVVGTGLLAAYFKLKSEVQTKITEVKTHTDVTLQKLNGMLTYVIHSFDRPAWIKIATQRSDGEVEFRMMELNDLYTESFDITRHEYLGKTDLEAGWDKVEADKMRENDLHVWASGVPTTFVEVVGGKPLKFRKIRVQSADGRLKGVMGYAVECEESKNLHTT